MDSPRVAGQCLPCFLDGFVSLDSGSLSIVKGFGQAPPQIMGDDVAAWLAGEIECVPDGKLRLARPWPPKDPNTNIPFPFCDWTLWIFLWLLTRRIPLG